MGSGPPLVLINGYAATKDDWDPGFLYALSRQSTVICPDNRGIGESDPATGELTFEGMAKDILDVIDALEVDSAAVAGWSLGGMVAQQLAAMAPDRVDALLLLSTDAGGPISRQATRDVGMRLFDYSGTPHEQARRMLELLFPADRARRLYEMFGDIVAEARAKLSHETLDLQRDALRRRYEVPAEDRLARIAAPALIATGSEDIVIPPENSEILAAHLRDSWLARFPQTGHAFIAQESTRLADLIAAFLGR